MCNCYSKYSNCKCRPKYEVGQKWLTKNGSQLTIHMIYLDYYWVSFSGLQDDPTTYRKNFMDEKCASLVLKTIKATVISYKYAKNGTVYTYVVGPDSAVGNTVDAWHKSAELGRIIILDEKEIELKCE